jgi:hypothetical protein
MKNPLYRSKSYFSGSKFGEYKRNTGPKDEVGYFGNALSQGIYLA